MRGTMQNKVDREACFNNEFDQFVVEPGEALVSVYNRFAQLMNDLERNGIKFPPVTVNTKFLNGLQPECLKYVTQVRLAKRLTEDTYDDLFDYLHQYEKLVNASRAKKLEKKYDPLALVEHTGSSSRTPLPYYVTHHSSVADYDDDYQGDAERGHYTRNCPKPKVRDSKYFMEQMLLAKPDEVGVTLTDEQNDFLVADASRMEEIEELSANICLMARIQPANIDSDAGPSYDSTFLSEVETPSTSYVNPLFAKDNQEQKYPKQPKIINDTFGDAQIDSNIIFDEPNVDVNSGSVEYDSNVQESYELETSAIRPRDQDDPHDDAHPEGKNSAKRHKTSEHGTYVFRESSSGQDNESELEMSETVDEAKLRKVIDEMLRQRCTSRDEHQYHIDQMQNFLKNDIVWESRKEILSLPHPQKPTPVVQSCQIDPKAPALSVFNQDFLYLKKDNSGPEKIMLSLHKFPAVIFPDDDIKERTFRWIFYIKRQKEPRKPKEEVYSNSKIVQVIKTIGELGHEHKFVTEIITRRANGSIMSITEPDYKNLNKNDIEDMYLLCINSKVDDYAETGLLWSLSVFIEHKMFSIISEPIYGIIYKNSKKEKRVMRHQEIHKFCDATLKRVLEGLKSYYNDVKHGYVTPSLSKEDVECLQLFEEEIEERLKHHDQMRRWEMYVNRRPLGSRRERPE
ncbi:hypothetical protein Tco_0321754 [Tanacetum coccineum]